MNRQILLVEPNYSNKYPPMGLMKLSTYYKNLGDHVSFFKGNLRDLVLSDTYEMLKKMCIRDRTWYSPFIRETDAAHPSANAGRFCPVSPHGRTNPYPTRCFTGFSD